jgi:anti-sigma regulatory factor (Ser/Thr protein kinase)
MRSDGEMEPVEIRVPLSAAAAASIRHAIADALAGHVPARTVADAQLVLSELVTNSVRHSGLDRHAVLRIAATLTGGILRLEVIDDGSAGAVVVRPPTVPGGGFGLNLVAMLSRAWGVERDGGTRVWVEMAARPQCA